MSRYHREHPDVEPDAYMERLYERADHLRTEQKDREWEEAMEESKRRKEKEASTNTQQP